LRLEVGDGQTALVFHLVNLPHPPTFYKFLLGSNDCELTLKGVKLLIRNSVLLTHKTLRVAITLPDYVLVMPWMIRTLTRLLASQHYVVIQILTRSHEMVEIVRLRDRMEINASRNGIGVGEISLPAEHKADSDLNSLYPLQDLNSMRSIVV
jgi:hypothetical protein